MHRFSDRIFLAPECLRGAAAEDDDFLRLRRILLAEIAAAQQWNFHGAEESRADGAPIETGRFAGWQDGAAVGNERRVGLRARAKGDSAGEAGVTHAGDGANGLQDLAVERPLFRTAGIFRLRRRE